MRYNKGNDGFGKDPETVKVPPRDLPTQASLTFLVEPPIARWLR